MVSQRYLALSLLVSFIERNRKHGRHPTDCLICGLSISLSVCFSTQRCQGAQNLHWFYGNQWPAIFASLRRSQQFRVHWAGCTCQSTGECSESQIFFFLFSFFGPLVTSVWHFLSFSWSSFIPETLCPVNTLLVPQSRLSGTSHMTWHVLPVEVVYVRTFALAVKSNTFKVCQNKTFVQMKIKLALRI